MRDVIIIFRGLNLHDGHCITCADSTPHAENTHFSRQVGVRAGGKRKIQTFRFKGT
jgi:hypothetical protein